MSNLHVGGEAVHGGGALVDPRVHPTRSRKEKDDGSSWRSIDASTVRIQMSSRPSVPRRPGYLRTRRAAPPSTLVGNPICLFCFLLFVFFVCVQGNEIPDCRYRSVMSSVLREILRSILKFLFPPLYLFSEKLPRFLFYSVPMMINYFKLNSLRDL